MTSGKVDLEKFCTPGRASLTIASRFSDAFWIEAIDRRRSSAAGLPCSLTKRLVLSERTARRCAAMPALREAVVTSLSPSLGPERNLLTAGPEHARQVSLDFPVIDNDDLAKIVHMDSAGGAHATRSLRGLYRVDEGPEALRDEVVARLRAVAGVGSDGGGSTR